MRRYLCGAPVDTSGQLQLNHQLLGYNMKQLMCIEKDVDSYLIKYSLHKGTGACANSVVGSALASLSRGMALSGHTLR